MTGFLPTQIPICFGMLLSAPTIRNTVMWQIVNQSYLATFNLVNKAPGSTFTNQDIGKGYFSAVSSAVGVSASLRYITAGITKRSSGSRLLALNTTIACVSCAIAAYFNTTCIR
jgi:hypothetical protein